MRLRDYTPRGYNARHILILIVPMLIFVVAMTLFFFYTHVEQVNAKLSRSVAEELNYVIQQRHENPDDWPKVVQGFSEAGLMDVTFTPGVKALTAPPGSDCCDQLGDELRIRFPTQPWSYRYLPGDLLTIRITAW